MRVFHHQVLFDGGDDARLAGCSQGQPARRQFTADILQQGHGNQRVIDQRFGKRHIAAFLGQQYKVHGVHAQATVFLGHRDTGETEFGKLLPECRVAARVCFPTGAQPLGGDFVDQKVADGILKQQLVFAESEIHGYLGIPSMRSAIMLR